MSHKSDIESPTLNNCLNCHAELSTSMKFCTQCGQPNRPTSLKIIDVLKDFAVNVFNLDGRLLMTIKNIWRPAHLTREYFSGKRRTYLLPTQYFLFSIFLFFTISLFLMPSLDKVRSFTGSSEFEKSKLAKYYDTLSGNYICNTSYNETFRQQLFGKSKKDTFYFPSKISSNWLTKYKITNDEVYSGVSVDTIISKHNIESPWDQFILRQFVKFEFNPVGTIKFIIGNLSWSIVLLIFFMSGISWLLYLRHYSYYLEHLILWMNNHSLIFLVLSLILLIDITLIHSEPFVLISFVFLTCLVVFSVRDYFKDTWFKLALKMLILITIYFTGLVFSMLFVSFISIFFL